MSGTLICYGDSNTYGYDPRDTNEGRYPKEVRWTGILDTETDWKVENHGVNGRSIPHTVSTCKICLSAGSRLASKAEFGMASGNAWNK